MMDVHTLLAMGEYMPMGATPDLHQLRFARVRVDGVRAQAFLDGRSIFTDGPELILSVDDIDAELQTWQQPSTPVILHVSFCGSTLLSHLLDIPGQSLGLREPAIQIDVADALATYPTQARKVAIIVEKLLSRPIGGQSTIIKPTNWANALLPVWSDQKSMNPVFMVMAPRQFLRAVFRGGRDRLTYTMRTAQHLSSSVKNGLNLIGQAVGVSTDPLEQAARLSLLALSFQLTLFQNALNMGRWTRERVIAFDELNSDPVGTAIRVKNLLNLPLTPSIICNHAETIVARNAKFPGRTFHADEEAHNNRVVEDYHSKTFDMALKWAHAQGINLAIAVR